MLNVFFLNSIASTFFCQQLLELNDMFNFFQEETL
jgi:hypothetical protein